MKELADKEQLWDLLGIRYASGLSPSHDPTGFEEIQLSGQLWYLPQSSPNPSLPSGSPFQRNDSGIWVTAPDNRTRLKWFWSNVSISVPLQPEHGPAPETFEYRQRDVPAIGYRSWSVETKKANGKWVGSLVGYEGFEWKSESSSRAACKFHKKSAPPVRKCGCGLYGWKRPMVDSGTWGPWLSPFDANTVRGAVMAWGRVLEYVDGFRAEHAKPTALYLEDENDWQETKLAELVAEAYGIPVVPKKEIVKYMTEFGEPLVT